MIRTELLPKVTVQRSKPVNLNEHDLYLFEHEFERELPPVYQYQFENAYVDYFGRVFNRNKTFIASKRLSNKNLFIRSIFKRKIHITETVLVIHDDWYYGYYHWVTESLTKLIALEMFTHECVLVLPEVLENYHTDSLKSFKFLNIVFLKPNQILQCSNILAIDYIAPMGNYNLENIYLLRKKILDFYDGAATAKFTWQNLYVSRSKAKSRKLINELEISDILSKHSFHTIYFEDYSFLEQIQIIRNCRNIIVLHGAGLTNMIFSKNKLNVIEIRGRNNSRDNCYFSLACALGHNYYYLIADEVRKRQYHLNPKEVLSLLPELE
jgi:capsular polysaccharide biosynthesis protein